MRCRRSYFLSVYGGHWGRRVTRGNTASKCQNPKYEPGSDSDICSFSISLLYHLRMNTPSELRGGHVSHVCVTGFCLFWGTEVNQDWPCLWTEGKPRRSDVALKYSTIHLHMDIPSLCNSQWHPLWLWVIMVLKNAVMIMVSICPEFTL